MSETVPASRFRTIGVVAAVVVLAAVGALLYGQKHTLGREGDQRRRDVEAGPRVRTFRVGGDGDAASLGFQGEALPMASATLYAKIGGFLKEIRVDKGSRVNKGELLAVIDSPETAKQALALKTSYENLQRNAERMEQLGRERIASSLDVDNALAAAQVAKQNWLAQTELEGYQKLTAPLAGVVTQRFVDPGAFIQNASGSLSSQPIVTVADTSRLRVTFFLDQASAGLAKVGQQVAVSPADRPDLVSVARLSRVAGTLDPRTRTMLAEADLDNRDGAFLGGGYVQVSLQLPKGTGRLEIPADALLMRGDRAFAVVLQGGRIHLQPLTLGEDVGTRVRVLKGLAAGDRIVMNPGPGLRDGDAVQALD